jgi:nucleoside-diphosphate-sugar epimerase
MKCLITGATGFLGKKILELLLEDARVQEIHIVSRKKRTHPHKKVRVHQADLSAPWGWFDEFEKIDAVIHLAALYQFNQTYQDNYRSNFLSTFNLIDRVSQVAPEKRPQILFASTYAVGLGTKESLTEEALTGLPASTEPYAYTKALSEKAISDSGLSARIFRLGVLVGNSVDGEIEKIDGPYYLMRCLDKLAQSKVARFLKKLPVPVEKDGIIPLVPVDVAAKVFHRALFLPPLEAGKKEYFGVYNSESVRLGELTYAIFENHSPPRFLILCYICSFILPGFRKKYLIMC